MKIYTKMGDEGKTSLVNSSNIEKSDVRLDVYGTSDELNSCIGIAIAKLKKINFENKVLESLFDIQARIFDFGSLLACDKKDWSKYNLSLIDNENIKKIELEIDEMESKNSKINFFILPGGSEEAAYLQLARTVCRRLERNLVYFYNLKEDEKCPELLIYINRLSDYLFVLARYVNKSLGISEKAWP